MKIVRKIGRGIGKTGKFFFNVPGWIGWRQMKADGKNITQSAKNLLQTPKPARQETFDEAVVRLHLSEQDIQQRMKSFFHTALAYSGIGLALFFYTVYLLFSGHISAGILSLLLTVIALTLSFRQHFFYFQMKQRRLGCTIKQWFNFMVGAKQ